MMNENPESRSSVRFAHQAPISLEHSEVGILHSARMFDYSSSGLYFESDFYLVPGSELFIGINNSPFMSPPGVYECYRAVIRWRKYLERSAYDYGYGVELKGRARSRSGPHRSHAPRRHARRRCTVSALVDDGRAKMRGIIRNVGFGGVFVACAGSFTAGQRLQLTIPLQKQQKLITRRGEVVWSDADGIGICFDPAGAPGPP